MSNPTGDFGRQPLGSTFKHPVLEITVPSNAGPGTPRIIIGMAQLPAELQAAGVEAVLVRIYGTGTQYWYQGIRNVAGSDNVVWGVADTAPAAVLEIERADIRVDATGAHFFEQGFINFDGSLKGVSFNDPPLQIASNLRITEKANGIAGRAVLVAGSVVVATTAVRNDSEIHLTTQIPGGAVGSPYISARVAGVSFTITSTNAGDTSTVAWLITRP